MVVLALCKNEEDPIKMKALECYKFFRHSRAANSDAQGQLAPQSVVESDQISNSSEIVWLSSLPVRMKKI